LPTVELDERLGLLFIHLEAVGNRLLGVVRPLNQLVRLGRLRALLVFDLTRGRAEQVEHAPAVGARTAAGNAAHQLAVVHIHLHDRIQWLSQLAQQRIERVCLREVARETIENETPADVGFRKPLADHAEHDIVVHELALVRVEET